MAADPGVAGSGGHSSPPGRRRGLTFESEVAGRPWWKCGLPWTRSLCDSLRGAGAAWSLVCQAAGVVAEARWVVPVPPSIFIVNRETELWSSNWERAIEAPGVARSGVRPTARLGRAARNGKMLAAVTV